MINGLNPEQKKWIPKQCKKGRKAEGKMQNKKVGLRGGRKEGKKKNRSAEKGRDCCDGRYMHA